MGQGLRRVDAHPRLVFLALLGSLVPPAVAGLIHYIPAVDAEVPAVLRRAVNHVGLMSAMAICAFAAFGTHGWKLAPAGLLVGLAAAAADYFVYTLLLEHTSISVGAAFMFPVYGLVLGAWAMASPGRTWRWRLGATLGVTAVDLLSRWLWWVFLPEHIGSPAGSEWRWLAESQVYALTALVVIAIAFAPRPAVNDDVDAS